MVNLVGMVNRRPAAAPPPPVPRPEVVRARITQSCIKTWKTRKQAKRKDGRELAHLRVAYARIKREAAHLKAELAKQGAAERKRLRKAAISYVLRH